MKQKILKHVQIYNNLYKDIKGGKYKVNDALPSEPNLAKELGVSRETLRKALSLLQEDGLVKNIRGKGNFICDINKIDNIRGIEIYDHPLKSSLKQMYQNVEIAFRIEKTTDYFNETLNGNYRNIMIIDRWYKNSDKVIAYSLSFLPIDIIAENSFCLEDNHILQFLETDIYHKNYNSNITIKITNSGNFTSEKYKLSSDDTFILLSEKIINKANKTILFTKHYIPQENFLLHINTK